MIKIFTGEDRVRATAEIRKYLGEDYEVIDAGELGVEELPSIFYGLTLFGPERRILIRDMAANSAVFGELSKYLDTPHKVALLETKIDKRGVGYKALRDKVEILEFPLGDKRGDLNLKFDIYRVAKRDGVRAVKMLGALVDNSSEDPIMFCGLMTSQVLKEFAANPRDARTRKALKALAKIDLQMKTTSTDGWLLVKSFLVRLSQF